MRIYIPLVGQFTNIGDTLHRSVLLEWLCESAELHVYIGNAPPSFLTGLKISNNIILYRSFFDWYLSALRSIKDSSFVYNPGEITGTKKRFLKEIVLMPLLFLYRMQGKNVLKVGVDIQRRGTFNDRLYWLANQFTNYSYYRTSDSYQRFSKGEVIPDLGFFRFTDLGKVDRSYIVLSMRSDKYQFNEELLRAISKFAVDMSLVVAVVAQVRMDNRSGALISGKLQEYGCEVEEFFWPDEVSHAQQEDVLNRVYAKSLLAISDRLHVLIAAANFSCIPICISSYFSHKVAKHFEVIGYVNMVYDLSGKDEEFLINLLKRNCERSDELEDKMRHAKKRLELARVDLESKLLH